MFPPIKERTEKSQKLPAIAPASLNKSSLQPNLPRMSAKVLTPASASLMPVSSKNSNSVPQRSTGSSIVPPLSTHPSEPKSIRPLDFSRDTGAFSPLPVASNTVKKVPDVSPEAAESFSFADANASASFSDRVLSAQCSTWECLPRFVSQHPVRGSVYQLSLEDQSINEFSIGETDSSTCEEKSPTNVLSTLSLLGVVVHVCCGPDFSAVLTIHGALWMWGSNEDGQLGSGHTLSIDHPHW